MIRKSVVLPDPDGPNMVKNSPSLMARSTPATAATEPKLFRTPVTRTAAGVPVTELAFTASSIGSLNPCRTPP